LLLDEDVLLTFQEVAEMRIAAIAMIAGIGLYAAKEPNVPQYDHKTETVLAGSIVKVYESGGTQFAKFETKTESVEVYLAPTSFINMLEIPMKTGQKDIEIVGSRVKFEGQELILARELRIGKNLYALRDRNGNPNWLWMSKTQPTGD
jgi:hypothetical protein